MKRTENLRKDFSYTLEGKILDSVQSEFQKIEIMEHQKFGRTMIIDDCFMTSEGDEAFYHELMVHPALLSMNNPKNVLIIGGGDGGLLEEVLKHNCIEKVTLIELDPMVIQMSQKWLTSIHKNSFMNPKVEILCMDGIVAMKEFRGLYDWIFLDLTDPSGPAKNLYTKEFFQLCKNHINKMGGMSLHIQSPITRPETMAMIVQTVNSVFFRIDPYFHYIPLYGTLWGFCIAKVNGNIASNMTEKQLETRIMDRGVGDLKIYSPKVHFSLFNYSPWIQETIDMKPGIIEKDTELKEMLEI